MPSLLSKFRHRKTGSQSSTSSVDQPPSSPGRHSLESPSRARHSIDQPNAKARSSLDQPRSPITSAKPQIQTQPQGDIPTSRTEEDVVVIDKSPTPTDPRSKPFVDESERPELPTTTSNVNNPLPQPHQSGSTTYLPQEDIDNNKPLPAVPEVRSPPIQSNDKDLRDFPLPPSKSSPSSVEPEHLRDRVKSPPLPHIDSVDRQPLHQVEEERPGLVGSSSRPPKSGEMDVVKGNYPHVSNLPHSDKREDLNELLNGQKEQVEIPSRGSSLYHHQATLEQQQSRSGGGVGGDRPEVELQEHRRDGKYTQPSSAVDPISKHPDGIINERFNNLSITDGGEQGLDAQRNAMISRLNDQIETKKDLTAEGVEVFKKVGMEGLLEKENSIDVRSRELKPVVKETIFPLEHTEYTTILTRCIHKTHYVPLIQPIHDPNPIILATRHRIYDPTTKKWHEVIGDAAAISILGEDVFRNGPKEYRELRKPALPGLEEMDEDALRMAKEAGLVSGGGLNTVEGVKDYEYVSQAQDSIPIKGEHEDVSIDGIGQGEGKGRVLEREYVLGTEDEEEKGDWKEIASYVGIGKGKGGLTKHHDEDQDQVGVAL